MSDGRSGRPLIVPLFLPNQGCPYRCVYCRQERIAGTGGRALEPEAVDRILAEAARSPKLRSGRPSEIAFYGGTFTGLPPGEMEDLLKAASAWVAGGPFQGVRVSTRPDALDEGRLSVLRRHGVDTVELGVQSMDDRVLHQSGRGYTSRDVVKAVERLKRFDLRVGIQLMPGLPGDSPSRFLETVRRSIGLRPDMARIYPTVVLEETVLADWYRRGRYRPLPLDRAVDLCTDACSEFEARGIPVIRIGLLAEGDLRETGGLVAGPWHPAFGFLVRSALYHRNIRGLVSAVAGAEALCIRVHPGDVHLLRGYRNRGIRALESKTGGRVLEVLPDERLPPGAPVIQAGPASKGGPGTRRSRI